MIARRTAARVALVAAMAALAPFGAQLSGCDDTGSYIYSGEQYDPVLQCLEPVSSIDIIGGNEPLNPCAPVCILSLPGDGGQIAYVSTMCGPYPFYPYELDSSTDPLCIAALEAFKIDALCEDGGVVIGAPIDAGPDADAGDGQTSDASQSADAPASDASSPSDASDAASSSDASDAASSSDASDATLATDAPVDATAE